MKHCKAAQPARRAEGRPVTCTGAPVHTSSEYSSNTRSRLANACPLEDRRHTKSAGPSCTLTLTAAVSAVPIIDAQIDWFSERHLCDLYQFAKPANDRLLTVSGETGLGDVQPGLLRRRHKRNNLVRLQLDAPERHAAVLSIMHSRRDCRRWESNAGVDGQRALASRVVQSMHSI